MARRARDGLGEAPGHPGSAQGLCAGGSAVRAGREAFGPVRRPGNDGDQPVPRAAVPPPAGPGADVAPGLGPRDGHAPGQVDGLWRRLLQRRRLRAVLTDLANLTGRWGNLPARSIRIKLTEVEGRPVAF